MSKRAKIVFAFLASALISCAEAGEWKILTQPDTPEGSLCRDLLKRFRKVAPMCSRDALQTYPEFEEPPWQKLDPDKHLDLIEKLLFYRGNSAFLDKPMPADPTGIRRSQAQDFVRHGGQVRIWRTRLTDFYDNFAQHPAPPGEQVVALLSGGPPPSPSQKKCGSENGARGFDQTFILLPDLSGPDPQVESGIAFVLEGARPVIFRGKPFLLYSSFGSLDQKTLSASHVVLYQNFPTTGLKGGGCDLEFDPDSSSK